MFKKLIGVFLTIFTLSSCSLLNPLGPRESSGEVDKTYTPMSELYSNDYEGFIYLNSEVVTRGELVYITPNYEWGVLYCESKYLRLYNFDHLENKEQIKLHSIYQVKGTFVLYRGGVELNNLSEMTELDKEKNPYGSHEAIEVTIEDIYSYPQMSDAHTRYVVIYNATLGNISFTEQNENLSFRINQGSYELLCRSDRSVGISFDLFSKIMEIGKNNNIDSIFGYIVYNETSASGLSPWRLYVVSLNDVNPIER